MTVPTKVVIHIRNVRFLYFEGSSPVSATGDEIKYGQDERDEEISGSWRNFEVVSRYQLQL
jgi:hypothetical protein